MKSISLYNFGGSEDLVRRIQTPFVNVFKTLGPVLDIGCGRGIFLELLSEAGIEAVGIDHSDESIARCREKGFIVHREEAREYLNRNRETFGGIFCSHVIEHMDYEAACSFLQLCNSALRAGGVLVIITPNPADIEVAEMFWMDPTHVRPYPKLLLRSMLEATEFRVTMEKNFLGNWRMVGRRNLPGYIFRRLLLGRYYGQPNTVLVAKKDFHSI
jgi:2-polyprenyl-3-methyl-5-hydroxy-6-metoxy-1,4-benzoquinol methylase